MDLLAGTAGSLYNSPTVRNIIPGPGAIYPYYYEKSNRDKCTDHSERLRCVDYNYKYPYPEAESKIHGSDDEALAKHL